MKRRSKPLARLTPLSRSGALRRVGLLAATKRRRGTGFSAKTAATVLDRDGHRCVVQTRCDGRPKAHLTVNHIVNRGIGGSSDPGINAVTNGISCCGPCNGWLEDFPLVAYRYGWKRRHGAPDGPVLYPDGEWYELLPNGQRRQVEAPPLAPQRYHGGAA